MSDTTTGDGGDSGWWKWIKLALMIIGAIVVLGVVFNIVSALFPYLIVAAVLYLGYRIFLKSDDSKREVQTEEPMLLEHDDSIFDEDDDLEARFRELERQESSLDR